MTMSKDQLIQSIRHETLIIQHLATKVAPGTLGYRPTPGQRSMLELMRYLTHCVHVPAAFVRDGTWDAAEAIEQQSEATTPEGFDAAMARQAEEVARIIEAIPHGDLQGRHTVMPWGAPCTVGQALVDMCLKPLVAYRMQFFLYVKQSGRPDIGPANCWVGRDPRKTA